MTFAECLFSAELIPVLCFIFGILLYKHEPKKINGCYGYRTCRSMKNEDTWKFANNLLGRLWLGGGAVLIVISAAAVLAVNASRHDMFAAVSGLAVIMDLVFMAASIIRVESALKKRFNDDGSRREDGSRE
ncbi:MAG: SdpI family protein [Clostridium sp.]|nr:SdpI family protein [Clostridium sp.]